MSKNENSTPLTFPSDFIFGVATAAYQIEGAAEADGRKPSIWDAFSKTPGRVVNGDTGDIACDHYNRWEDDLDLIQSLGVDAYRFSFAWPRIIPDGEGKVNDAGLAFYDKLIDGCLKRGIKPVATLYHWDLPLQLQGYGGWTKPRTAHAFADYSSLIVRHFGDRLENITTFNEPWCSAILSYLYGIHAPGEKNLEAALAAVHTQHLGHGLAIQAMRAEKPDLPMGIVLNLQSVYPGAPGVENEAAAQRHKDFHNGLFLEPLFNGNYPNSVIEALGSTLPSGWENDLSTIQQPLDFWGLNYYTPARVLDNENPNSAFPRTLPMPIPATTPKTDIGWEIAPSTFGELLTEVYAQYDLPPCYITENGACFNNEVENGEINDNNRVSYLKQHLQQIANVTQAGIPVKGYFAWSLMDNFEWAEGYNMRFGIVHVDYQTQKRTIKKSGHWYSQLASQGRVG